MTGSKAGSVSSCIVRTPALQRAVSIIGGPKYRQSPCLHPVAVSSRLRCPGRPQFARQRTPQAKPCVRQGSLANWQISSIWPVGQVRRGNGSVLLGALPQVFWTCLEAWQGTCRIWYGTNWHAIQREDLRWQGRRKLWEVKYLLNFRSILTIRGIPMAYVLQDMCSFL